LMLTEEEQDGKVTKKVQLAVRQLKKAEDMLTHLVSDIRPPPQIQKTIMLPNISRRQLERVLSKNQNIRKEEGQVEEAVTCLVEAAKRGPLCVIADEVCGSEFTDFCSSLLQRVPGVRLWAASLYHADRPSCLEEVRMTEPLRTPPAVTREVQKAFWIERFGAVLGYAESSVPPPSEGPAARVVRHQGQGHAEGRPGECERCGLEIAHLLRELHVAFAADALSAVFHKTYLSSFLSTGQYEKSQTGPLNSEASIVASQTTTSTSAKTCPASPPPLQFRDVFILNANVLTDAVLHDEETDNTGNILRPASGMLRGLRRARVPVRVVRSRDNDVIADVAKMAGADEVVAGEVGAVRGLERKIVIWVQTDRPVTGTEDESWGRLEGASRATGQVVWVVWPQDDDLIS
ncbi:hypothetical protein BaRGS_00024143, partial [Batillaria attramentaria]